MKKILMAASALALVATTTPAMAQTGTVNVSGTVAEACNMPAFNIPHTISLALDSEGYLAIGNDGSFVEVVDLGSVVSGFEAWCNTAAEVSVTGNRLVHESLPPNTFSHVTTSDGFAKTIPLRIANLNVGGANGVTFGENALNTGSTLDNGGPVSLPSAGPFAGGVDGSVQMWAMPQRPVAGGYSATWTLTIAAN